MEPSRDPSFADIVKLLKRRLLAALPLLRPTSNGEWISLYILSFALGFLLAGVYYLFREYRFQSNKLKMR
jgi:hypothetical protein